MRKLFLIALALLFVPWFAETQPASARNFQDNQNSNARSTERRHVDRRRHRRHRRGIGQSYKQAGISTARGGAGFGKNVARRKPIKAGKVLGTNMKEAGQNVGEGSKQVGDTVVDKSKTVGRKTKATGTKVVDKTKKVVKPQ